MNVEIICPLYNAEEYIKDLDKSFKKQKNVEIKRISYILTKSIDNTEQILKEIKAQYSIIEPKEFSHSLSREQVAMKSLADILVFVTQDVHIESDEWLEKLIKPIVDGESDASFSRQLTKYDNIEKYTREKNYPAESYVVSKNDLDRLGLRTFFFSDASSAIRTETFKKIDGYDNKKLPTNEDMYIAYKLIMKDYKIKYCSDSILYHSHDFKLKELYKRYFDTGIFFSQNNYLDKFGTNKTGGGLAVYILKRAVEEKNWSVLIKFVPNMMVRFLGMKLGRIYGQK